MSTIRRYIETGSKLNPSASLLSLEPNGPTIAIEVLFPAAIEEDSHNDQSILKRQFGENLDSFPQEKLCDFLVYQAKKNVGISYGSVVISPQAFTEHEAFSSDGELSFQNIALQENRYIKAFLMNDAD